MNYSISIAGADEIAREFATAPRQLVPLALLRAAKAAGKILEDAIRAAVPVERGDLRADLATNITLDSEFRGVVVDVGFADQGYVARFVEYGHRQLSHKWKSTGQAPDGQAGRVYRLLLRSGLTKSAARMRRQRVQQRVLGSVAPRPFIRPASMAVEERMVEVFNETLMENLRGLVDGD